MSAYQVLLYYKFVPVPDPELEAAIHLELCQELGLRGRIIIASEGINGTVSGLRENTEKYIDRMNSHPLFNGIEYKIDDSDSHVFKRLSVKARAEIVTLGVEADAVGNTGQHLSPAEFRDKLQEPDVLVLDIRNDYEYEMGRFRGAVRPPVETFKEFPTWILDNFADAKDRPLLTYCTGGIRCEKLTAFLKDQGFRDVYQLDGGIVTYAKDPEVRGEGFEGDCFVFDDRLSVPIAPPVSVCEKCGQPSSRYVNCSNVDCNRLYFLCGDCESSIGLACCGACQSAVRQREHNARLSPTLRSEAARERKRRHRAKRAAKLAAATKETENSVS